MTTGTLMTADELSQLPDDGWHYELVRGELRKMSPSGSRHGRVAARIITSLSNYVEPRKLGGVYASETGFRIGRAPDSVRAPDAAFVRAERVVDTPRFSKVRRMRYSRSSRRTTATPRSWRRPATGCAPACRRS